MRVFVTNEPHTYPGSHPSIALGPDLWDDYGLKTTFSAVLWVDRLTAHDLRKVKIMRLGMKSGQPDLEPVYENGLPDDYASLGADFDYYERLEELSELRDQVLHALRDLAFDPVRYEQFQTQSAFNASLIRLAPAKDALRRIRQMSRAVEPSDDNLGGSVALDLPASVEPDADVHSGTEVVDALKQPLMLEFTPVHSEYKQLQPPTIVFNFDGPEKLPRNLVAVIGPNGTGKTTLLADLALALFFGGTAQLDGGHPLAEARLTSGSVRDVIFISYSAYDSFEVPKNQDLPQDAKTELERQGYIYVGLRKLNSEDRKSNRDEQSRVLKSIREIEEEFANVLSRLDGASSDTLDRRSIFAAAVKVLFKDPSLAQMAPIAGNSTTKRVIERVGAIFPTLSTGHKATMNIVASLSLHLKTNSLVLIDEPEAHLHPPLISSLLKVVRELLGRFQAHAIVATHSPVVIQETLGRHVLVLNRIDTRTNWRESERETFGENIATLTRESLGLPAANADYIGQLAALIGKDTQLEEVERLFGERGMSSPARAQALRIISAIQASRKN